MTSHYKEYHRTVSLKGFKRVKHLEFCNKYVGGLRTTEKADTVEKLPDHKVNSDLMGFGTAFLAFRSIVNVFYIN